ISLRIFHLQRIYGGAEWTSSTGSMAADAISPQYLSTGANRCTPGADWIRDGLVAFRADSKCALRDPAVSHSFLLRPRPPLPPRQQPLGGTDMGHHRLIPQEV